MTILALPNATREVEVQISTGNLDLNWLNWPETIWVSRLDAKLTATQSDSEISHLARASFHRDLANICLEKFDASQTYIRFLLNLTCGQGGFLPYLKTRPHDADWWRDCHMIFRKFALLAKNELQDRILETERNKLLHELIPVQNILRTFSEKGEFPDANLLEAMQIAFGICLWHLSTPPDSAYMAMHAVAEWAEKYGTRGRIRDSVLDSFRSARISLPAEPDETEMTPAAIEDSHIATLIAQELWANSRDDAISERMQRVLRSAQFFRNKADDLERAGLQDIATAPKDGTGFWGLCDGNLIRMWWDDRFDAFTSTHCREENPDGSFHGHTPSRHQPRKWMPIPPM